MMGFQESNAKEVTLHDDNPEALEIVLRYLYGFEDDLLSQGELIAQAIHVSRVIVAADKYGVDRKFITGAENVLSQLVSEMEEPRTVMTFLETCTLGPEVHPSLAFTVEEALCVHMVEPIELPEWFDWIHSLPSVNRKISEESVRMKQIKRNMTISCCNNCDECVFPDPATSDGECSCGDPLEEYTVNFG